jgi:hypothetical protein
MPTKRRRVTRGTTRQSLTLALIDLALGHLRTPKEIDELHAQGQDYDSFLMFDRDVEERIATAWNQHRDVLLAEWRRRGGTGLPRSCPRV